MKVFVDTSGFFALLAKRDSQHQKANTIVREGARQRTTFVTSDYVLDETATLLKDRGDRALVAPFFELVFASRACEVDWTEEAKFVETLTFFLKHKDKSWSFTDCLSFLIMRERRLHQALTKDIHFEQAGFTRLLSA